MQSSGRKRESRLEPKYPAQEQVRIALWNWVEKQRSLREAAAELCITFRELSNFRHSQRWIPDRIVEFLGFDPKIFRAMQKNSLTNEKHERRVIRGEEVVDAAVKLVRFRRSPDRHNWDKEQNLMIWLTGAVDDFLAADKRRTV